MHSEDADAFVTDGQTSVAGTAALTILTVQHNELAILTVQGSIDVLTAPQLSDAVSSALSGEPRGLIIDLTSTEFLASAGMSALVTAYEAIAPGGLFGVVADGPSTSRPIQLVGLDQTLTLYPTLDQAIAAMA
ncbi:STAS domain-containing protein [Williamsia sp. 1135]|uniref:STAS domain-containing protein n=1 Tax=Williamsia sp. 1135 TaxID=1889262 RepID=UPI000A0F5BEC|nr:STAS domain-containing protein [Williamsia sp. 1135]ORM30640.1 anti-anti-sigma factor [Williamsia sp. 1135]